MKKLALVLICTIFLFGCSINNSKNKKDSNPAILVNVPSKVEGVKESVLPQEEPKEEPAPKSIPESIDLEAPFVSQAPLGNWDNLHNEACEEASVLSVVLYLENQNMSREEIDIKLIEMVQWQEDNFGGHYDLPTAKVKEFVEKYYDGKYKVKIVYDPSQDDIKQAIASKNPVIIPASGRTLANPHYKSPGPVYHMIVLRGYDNKKKEFITNDVGTHHTGDGYRFNMDKVYKAIHDMPQWQQNKELLDADPDMIFNGRKAMIIINK